MKVERTMRKPEELGKLLIKSINSIGYESLILKQFHGDILSGAFVLGDNEGDKATILTKSPSAGG